MLSTMTHVHSIVQGIDCNDTHFDRISVVNFIKITSLVVDHVIPHLNLSTLGMLAQTCKSFRKLTTDVTAVDYVIKLLPQRNSRDTRRCFLIPRSVPLLKISRGVYSQAHSFHSTIQKYGGMLGFRDAVERRRKLTHIRRQTMIAKAFAERMSRDRRLQMIVDALAILKLPALSRYHTTVTLFINNVPPVHVLLEEARLSLIMENMCWVHHLVNHTDFTEHCQIRRALVGDYQELERDIMDEFARPDVWPWLE